MSLISNVSPRRRRLRETILSYRRTFEKDVLSRQTLAWLLESCGLLKKIETEEQRILHNWGIYLLENMGALQGFNYEDMVDTILKLTIPEEAIDTK
jgi:hypothetical protein